MFQIAAGILLAVAMLMFLPLALALIFRCIAFLLMLPILVISTIIRGLWADGKAIKKVLTAKLQRFHHIKRDEADAHRISRL